MTFAQFLEARGIPREAAAIMAGVHPSTLSRIINGRVTASPQTILRLAKAFDVAPRRMKLMLGAHSEPARVS